MRDPIVIDPPAANSGRSLLEAVEQAAAEWRAAKDRAEMYRAVPTGNAGTYTVIPCEKAGEGVTAADLNCIEYHLRKEPSAWARVARLYADLRRRAGVGPYRDSDGRTVEEGGRKTALCRPCRGTGNVPTADGMRVSHLCPECGGDGFVTAPSTGSEAT